MHDEQRGKKSWRLNQRETLLAGSASMILLIIAAVTCLISTNSWRSWQKKAAASREIIIMSEKALVRVDSLEHALVNEELSRLQSIWAKISQNLTAMAGELQTAKTLIENKEETHPNLLALIEDQKKSIGKILQSLKAQGQLSLAQKLTIVRETKGILESIKSTEINTLKQKSAKANAQTQTAIVAASTAIVLSMILIAICGLGITGEVKKTQQTKEELERLVSQRTMELEHASQAKNQFLAVMNHEIRTPLNSIIGWAELLNSSLLNPEQRAEIKSITASAKALETLIGTILDFSKIENGKLEVQLETTHPRDILEETLAICESLKKDEIEIKIQIGDQESHILCDKPRIAQILVNLVSNALKFTEEGTIHLRYFYQSENANFEVEDTGVGIPQDRLHAIFEPFTQANSSTSRKHGGTGLGLTIARRLAAGLQGEILVESIEGKGSKFTLRIPAVFSSASPLTPENKDNPPKRKILLVEDNMANRRIATLLLHRLGQGDCDQAENGHTALRLSSLMAYDLIFMDIEMPDMDGIEVTKAIRQLEKSTGRTPAFISSLTAHAVQDVLNKCLEAGMDINLTKPISLQKLREIIVLSLKK